MIKETRKRARQELDKTFSRIPTGDAFAAPPKGWIRAIRDALGMTAEQLGKRLGVVSQSLEDIERSERQGSIQIKTLKKVADAMNCTLVYSLVPKEPLEQMVEKQARQIAERRLTPVIHSMRLEDQGPIGHQREEAVEDYIRNVLKDKDLWAE